MRKASDVKNLSHVPTEADKVQRAEIEAAFDAAIDLADMTGSWPAIVCQSRSGWLSANLKAVVEAYIAQGWRVSEHRDGWAVRPLMERS